ncbi:MAG: tetratricopeptide repeat protein [Opitutaceae bacterium]|nr:tetratricopeptide repeat protein [Opitutaceae bacterium]
MRRLRAATAVFRALRVHAVRACVVVWVAGAPVWGGLAARAWAQESAPATAAASAPFSSTSTVAEASRGHDIVWQFELADSAMRGGYHSLAERLYQEILERKDADDAVRRRAALGRIDAWIAQGRGADVALALEAMGGGRDEAWRLRRAVAHFLIGMSTRTPAEEQREFAGMGELLRDLHPEMFPRDAGWLFFLRGMAALRAGNNGEAEQNFVRAEAAAISEAERSMFRVANWQAGLAASEPTEDLVAKLQETAERYAGRQLGLLSTLQLAVVRDRMGNKSRAVAELKRQRETMPATEVELRDQTLLLLGLIAGASSEDGRQALRELLERGQNIDFQRVALMRLAAAARVDSAGSSADLRRLLSTLLDRPAPHPLTEDLLFFRAELALRARAFEEAENDARAVLSRFPGSSRMRREALSILASSSWQRPPRYRTAADYLAQIQALPEVSVADKAQLALLQGECYFRAGRQDNTVEDYRNAAEAYAAIQAGGVMPTGVSPGVVFFQRVLALINARALDAAVRLLDDPAARAGVDVESWWQSEWNLARELQLLGRGAEAVARADAMGPVVGVPAELRLRFLWLAAQVSLESGRRDETTARVDRVREFVQGPQGAELSAERRAEVMSNGLLVAAEAPLRAGDRDGARAALERLRTEFPTSLAADYSYIVEAGFLAAENRLVEAMQQLLRFVDARPGSRYAPEALYQAALLSIQRGQKEHLDEANRLLEQMAQEYGEDNYVFQARLKQAEVKLSLGAFSDAEAIYRDLEDKFPNHADRPIVQISLAGAFMAQATVEPAKFDGAVSRFERLMANESLPVDLRAEAGARLAEGWQAQGNTARAAEICWEVYHRFVEDPNAASPLGATGPSWISRAIFLLGDIEERDGRFENARRLYQSVIDHGLPGEKIADAKIKRISAPVGVGG